MKEKNNEIVTLIGRRLREAVDAGQARELPQSMRVGLERLDELETSMGGSQEPRIPGLSRQRTRSTSR